MTSADPPIRAPRASAQPSAPRAAVSATRLGPREAAAGARARLTRRRLIGLGTGGLLVATAGCLGEDDGTAPRPLFGTPVAEGTPISPVPGYEAPDRWAGRTLRVGAWGGEVQEALREAVWRPFGAATGCAIEEVIVDYSRLTAGGQTDPYADALVVGAEWAATALDGGFVQPLTAAAESAGVDLLERSGHSLPAYAYAMVGAYRRDALEPNVAEPPADWRAWWDRALYPGDRTLFKGAFGTFEFALMADGVPPDALYPLDGARAIESLKRISGAIVDRWWETGGQAISWIARDRADFGSAWHYRVAAAQRDGQPVELVWNQGLLVADHWVVPAGAANADVAMDFLGYASAPQVQAALARRVSLGPVVGAAFDFLEPLFAATLPTWPDNRGRLVLQDVAWWAANAVEANGRFNSWLLGAPDG